MGEPTIINCKVGVLNVARAARDALANEGRRRRVAVDALDGPDLLMALAHCAGWEEQRHGDVRAWAREQVRQRMGDTVQFVDV
jgi:hypothetical protein